LIFVSESIISQKHTILVRKIRISILLIPIVLISLIGFVSASAYDVLNPKIVHAVITTPVSVFGKNYDLQINNKTYPIYYGFNVTYAVASNISFTPEDNSILITLKNVTETDAMWIQFPQSIISADRNNFALYVDGNNEKYEIATSGHSIILGFMVTADTHLIKIQGTQSIPEFPLSSTYGLAIGLMTVLVFRFRRF
jgi:hypothetical protein